MAWFRFVNLPHVLRTSGYIYILWVVVIVSLWPLFGKITTDNLTPLLMSAVIPFDQTSFFTTTLLCVFLVRLTILNLLTTAWYVKTCATLTILMYTVVGISWGNGLHYVLLCGLAELGLTPGGILSDWVYAYLNTATSRYTVSIDLITESLSLSSFALDASQLFLTSNHLNLYS